MFTQIYGCIVMYVCFPIYGVNYMKLLPGAKKCQELLVVLEFPVLYMHFPFLSFLFFFGGLGVLGVGKGKEGRGKLSLLSGA